MSRLRFALCSILLASPAIAGVVPVVPRPPADVAPVDTEELDPAALADRIAANARDAGDRLANGDAGDATHDAQQKVLDDLDRLLKAAENPPPPPPPMPMPPSGPSSSPPPGGAPPQPGGGSPKPEGGQKPKPQGRRERGGNRPMGEPSGGPTGKPMPKAGQPGGQKPEPAGLAGGRGSPAMPDAPPDDAIEKQVWGHLPERLRRQMTQYYREQFSGQYGELLRDYYSALAEREKGGRK